MEFIFVIFKPFDLSWWIFLLYTLVRDVLRDSGLFDDFGDWILIKIRRCFFMCRGRKVPTTPYESAIKRRCADFLVRYRLAEINIWTELYASVLIAIILLYDTFLMISLDFGLMFSLGESDFICKASNWSECHDARWLVIAAFGVLLIAEVIGVFLTLFILNSRIKSLLFTMYENHYCEGTDPNPTIRSALIEPLKRAVVEWRLNAAWMAMVFTLCLVYAFRFVSRFGYIIDACKDEQAP